MGEKSDQYQALSAAQTESLLPSTTARTISQPRGVPEVCQHVQTRRGPLTATRSDVDGRIGLSGVLLHPKRRSIGKYEPDHGKSVDLSLLPLGIGTVPYCHLAAQVRYGYGTVRDRTQPYRTAVYGPYTAGGIPTRGARGVPRNYTVWNTPGLSIGAAFNEKVVVGGPATKNLAAFMRPYDRTVPYTAVPYPYRTRTQLSDSWYGTATVRPAPYRHRKAGGLSFMSDGFFRLETMTSTGTHWIVEGVAAIRWNAWLRARTS
ncbi:hypothetical protein GGX14DRAFT_404040 [Mycena pura]|uniref:Uncharacterized protein n=1 Tax=Mycena pura TaxID=153505 RepID=A0AAD6UV22_9AGAR|nr:hypothetical protein GGX14DRAFT_404040 [Mycena pura]